MRPEPGACCEWTLMKLLDDLKLGNGQLWPHGMIQQTYVKEQIERTISDMYWKRMYLENKK